MKHFLGSIALLATACGGTQPTPATPRQGLQIKLATIHVDDQDKALAFYTGVLGFAKNDDEKNGDFRWLTVTAPGDADGTALQLALDSDPAAKAFQEARFAKGEPAAMLFTTDLAADVARIEAKGAKLTMEPTEVMPGVSIATFDDGVGNLIQLSQIKR